MKKKKKGRPYLAALGALALSGCILPSPRLRTEELLKPDLITVGYGASDFDPSGGAQGWSVALTWALGPTPVVPIPMATPR